MLIPARPLVPAALALCSIASPLAAQNRPSVAPPVMQAIAPDLARDTDETLFGDVWLRPDLSPRDRSLITVSALIATGKVAQLGGHLNRGLTNGLKPVEVVGIVTQLAFYTGWPNAVSALPVVEQVFVERQIDRSTLARATRLPLPAADAARAQDQVAPVAPKLAELTNKLLFGDLWLRTDLSKRDRSLVTIAALAANGDSEQLRFHIDYGLDNGLTRAEIGEAFTHLAFYAGWPKAMAAIGVARSVFGNEEPTPALTLTPPGRTPRPGPASNFVGSVTVTSPFNGTGDSRLSGATVRFLPGARTNWHSHPLGQLLIVTEGAGWVQVEGEPVRAITAGDVIWTAPGKKHWHGATRTSAMQHTAIAERRDGGVVTWLEPVSNAQYRGPR